MFHHRCTQITIPALVLLLTLRLDNSEYTVPSGDMLLFKFIVLLGCIVGATATYFPNSTQNTGLPGCGELDIVFTYIYANPSL